MTDTYNCDLENMQNWEDTSIWRAQLIMDIKEDNFDKDDCWNKGMITHNNFNKDLSEQSNQNTKLVMEFIKRHFSWERESTILM